MTVLLRLTQSKTPKVRQEYRCFPLLAQIACGWNDLDSYGKFIDFIEL